MNVAREKLLRIFNIEESKKSVHNAGDLSEIISGPAYRDMQPRHFKGIGDKKTEREKAFRILADEFKAYFDNPSKSQNEFDAWHNNACGIIMKEFERLTGYVLYYGKAQKLINMSFKNIYSFVDAEDRCFEYCHIPLDSRILEWYTSITGKETIKWSYMDYEEYIEVQKNIREYLKSPKNKRFRLEETPFTPFEADFYVWGRYNMESILNNCIKTFDNFTEWNVYQEYDWLNKVVKIRDIAESAIQILNHG